VREAVGTDVSSRQLDSKHVQDIGRYVGNLVKPKTVTFLREMSYTNKEQIGNDM